MLTDTWDLDKAVETYRIDRWGSGFFGINPQGELAVYPRKNDQAISIPDVISKAARRNQIHAPFLLRCQDILRYQVIRVNDAFSSAIDDSAYHGRYRGVFPIKVNHLREVVEEILDAGSPYHFGLEVGSKPELVIALALHQDPESLLICNGYKDNTFIDLALSGRQLGKPVIMVLEKREELQRILERSRLAGIQAFIGMRLRLQTKGSGKWAMSGGEGAKFGLSTPDLIDLSGMLKNEGLQDWFKLLHFHVGSQLSDINQCTLAVREGARTYAKLRQMGFPIEAIDIGGGLGVDYDGSRTASDNSINYTLEEFAASVVQNILEICDEEDVPHPDIVSESGRAIVAHHSVLIVQTFGSIEKGKGHFPPPSEEADRLLHQLHELDQELNSQNRRASLHQAQLIKEEASSRFGFGLLSLEDKAAIENGFWHLARRVENLFDQGDESPPEIIDLRAQLGDMFLCNFSVFQSLIDYWAVKQLFPIAPVERLLEAPTLAATLVDITCDSDGKIDDFIGEGTPGKNLPLHEPNGSPYWLAFFLMGAYQDIMGDIHNLFGSVPEVHVFLDEDDPDGYYIEEIVHGHNISDVLFDVQYEPKQLLRQLKKQVDTAIREDYLKPREGMDILRQYEDILKGNTYLNLHDG